MLHTPELTYLPMLAVRHGLLKRQTVRTLYCASVGFHSPWSLSEAELIRQEVRQPEQAARFSLAVSYGPRHRYREPYPTIFWATPAGLVLTWDAQPLAALGFESIGSAVVVVQIQGVRGAGPYLQAVRWERLLLRSVIQIAESAKRDTVVVPASSDMIPGYAKQRMLCATAAEREQVDARYDRRYRQPAVSLGFQWSDVHGVFIFPVHG